MLTTAERQAIYLLSSTVRGWNVITAMRGPDQLHAELLERIRMLRDYSSTAYCRGDIKEATTRLIRGVAGASLHCPALVSYTDDARNVPVRQEMSKWAAEKGRPPMSEFGPTLHFIEHCQLAFEDLGLEWETLNKEKANADAPQI